ncbi:hypothetical protein M8818_003045 [Zalaria obscura]|uniref:Uncharacterized protein n=1 Tax=Zalaria obscura TaxID=2024903 RepID=A0ACC3SG67_9PEZI
MLVSVPRKDKLIPIRIITTERQGQRIERQAGEAGAETLAPRTMRAGCGTYNVSLLVIAPSRGHFPLCIVELLTEQMATFQDRRGEPVEPRTRARGYKILRSTISGSANKDTDCSFNNGAALRYSIGNQLLAMAPESRLCLAVGGTLCIVAVVHFPFPLPLLWVTTFRLHDAISKPWKWNGRHHRSIARAVVHRFRESEPEHQTDGSQAPPDTSPVEPRPFMETLSLPPPPHLRPKPTAPLTRTTSQAASDRLARRHARAGRVPGRDRPHLLLEPRRLHRLGRRRQAGAFTPPSNPVLLHGRGHGGGVLRGLGVLAEHQAGAADAGARVGEAAGDVVQLCV